jgi:hypothetical protein
MDSLHDEPSDRSLGSTRHSLPDPEALGIINALERTCELEARLRAAIQQTHPLTTTLEWDFVQADKEREALLAIRCARRAGARRRRPPASAARPRPPQFNSPRLSAALTAASTWSTWKTNCARRASRPLPRPSSG